VNRRIRFNGYWLAIGAVVLVAVIFTIGSVRGSVGADAVASQLRRMAKDGKNFDPTRLHALGPEGLTRVLDFLSDRYTQRFVWPTTSFADGFDVYVRGINDRERLLMLAQHLQVHLKDGVPHFNYMSWNNDKPLTIKSCVAAFAQNDQDENAGKYAAALAPCLEYSNGRVGTWLISSLEGHDNGHPLIAYGLMIEALGSKHTDLVAEALDSATECAQTNKREIVHERLIKIFNGPDEENKFQACFALMHQFKHQPAVDYLLEQTASPNQERARRATDWIGDTCNWGQPAYPALLEALDPLLGSDDRELRGSAVDTLTTYAGPEVTSRLLVALADEDRSVVETARRSLIERAIGRAVRLRDNDLPTTLQNLAETHENAQVRRECAAILEALQLQQGQSASRP
jgi:hypothetical protein